jgi:hypothetical protein
MELGWLVKLNRPVTFGAVKRVCGDLMWRFMSRRGHPNSAALRLLTLAWGRRYLRKHFEKPASAMHEWLGAQLDQLHVARGSKVNLIGPRGSAKSTIATLCYVLRAAVEQREPYILIVSDTKPQAEMHLENVKTELIENGQLAQDYPGATGRGPSWRANVVELRNGVIRSSRSARGSERAADGESSIDRRSWCATICRTTAT